MRHAARYRQQLRRDRRYRPDSANQMPRRQNPAQPACRGHELTAAVEGDADRLDAAAAAALDVEDDDPLDDDADELLAEDPEDALTPDAALDVDAPDNSVNISVTS